MGCVGSTPAENNIFRVKNINDSRDLVQKGLMEVTQTELVYIDSTTRQDWHWPLKYLRKYGCDGDVFTFEAGRKCPGGEGLYAFSTRKASALFELVAKNINQGELQPSGELSPFNESQTADSTGVLTFPPHRPSTSPTGTEQPSYTNLDIMGNPLPNGDPTSSSSNPNGPTVAKSVYREVVFDKPAEEHPVPQTNPQRTTSYSKIDFEQTAKYNRDARLGVPLDSAVPGPQQPHHGRVGSTSGHSHHRHNGSSRSGGSAGRSRHNTYTPGNSRDRNKSESSFSSQSSLTESSRDVRDMRHNPRANGPLTTDPNSSMYQNVHIGGGASGLQEPQQQYQNVSVGAGSVNQVFENGGTPQQQPNYCNITMSSTATSANGGGMSPDLNATTNSIRVNGMGNYAQLELSSDTSSRTRSKSSSSTTPTSAPPQSSYLQLDFPAERNPSPTGGSHTHQSGRRSASLSAVGTSSSSPDQKPSTHTGIIHEHIPEEEAVVATPAASSSNPVKDPTRVEYEMLNFPAMKALEELSTQREQEIEKEKEQREKEQKEKEQKEREHKEKEKGKKKK